MNSVFAAAHNNSLQAPNSGDIHDKFCQGENGDFP